MNIKVFEEYPEVSNGDSDVSDITGLYRYAVHGVDSNINQVRFLKPLNAITQINKPTNKMKTYKMNKVLSMINDGKLEAENDVKVGYVFIRWTNNNKRECIKIENNSPSDYLSGWGPNAKFRKPKTV